MEEKVITSGWVWLETLGCFHCIVLNLFSRFQPFQTSPPRSISSVSLAMAVNLDRLPPETISRILSYFPKKSCAKFATVSRSWRDAVERITFAHIKTTSYEHRKFKDVIVKGDQNRLPLLQTLHYVITLPHSKFRQEKVAELAVSMDTCAFSSELCAFICIVPYRQEAGTAVIWFRRNSSGQPVSSAPALRHVRVLNGRHADT